MADLILATEIGLLYPIWKSRSQGSVGASTLPKTTTLSGQQCVRQRLVGNPDAIENLPPNPIWVYKHGSLTNLPSPRQRIYSIVSHSNVSPAENPPTTSTHSLLRSVGVVSFFTFFSRLLGFARDIVIARGFGAGMGADAFIVALKLPNFLRRLFAEGAFSTAFVPVFSDYLVRGDRKETHEAVCAVFTALLVVLTLLVLICLAAMPWLIYLLAPGFNGNPEKIQLTIDLTRITFPYILFIALVALAGGILNSHDHFGVPAATPMLLNICMIGCALFLSPHLDEPSAGLAIGVFLGGVTQLAMQWPALKKIGMGFSWRWDPKHPAIARTLNLMGPSVLGVSVAQINLLFDLFIASWLPEGSISYLYYADRLVEFPLGLVGIAMATAILPALSARAAAGDIDGLHEQLDIGLRFTLLLNIPATVALILLREPLVALLFERGAFTADTTRQAAQALFAYSIGLTFYSLVKVTAPAFYALKDTRTPVRIAITAMISNSVLNIVFMFPLQHAGLALATSLSALLNASLLLHRLHQKTGFSPKPGFWTMFGKTIAASLIMTVILVAALPYLENRGYSLSFRTLVLTATVFTASSVYFATAWILRIQEVRIVFSMMRRRKKPK
ncbi:MAG: murein biosynthesis integral membrane protein MurJ [Magnetococcales bacterium]|nr:murein biosynthesis integral membrane protein MurJ [Magnetococcales bacterium]